MRIYLGLFSLPQPQIRGDDTAVMSGFSHQTDDAWTTGDKDATAADVPETRVNRLRIRRGQGDPAHGCTTQTVLNVQRSEGHRSNATLKASGLKHWLCCRCIYNEPPPPAHVHMYTPVHMRQNKLFFLWLPFTCTNLLLTSPLSLKET